MPRKNTLRTDIDDSFFHIYNRGVARTETFRCDDDFRYFEYLLERQLSSQVTKNKDGREYPNFHGRIEIHSYCLMPNHFHILLRQIKAGAIRDFFKSLTISYSMYFNHKYNRRGPIFESQYKAIYIDKDEYLMHLSRYIHLNPLGFRSWEYSSYNDFLFSPREWITVSFLLDMFRTKKHYIAFVEDYKEKDEQADLLESIFGDT